MLKSKMDKSFRLFDFNIYNDKKFEEDDNSDDSTEFKQSKDNNIFMIQMFGINEKGETCSIIAENFKPFFYVKVEDDWNKSKKTSFLAHIKQQIGKYYEDSICECKLVKRKKLYGFDGGKRHKFILFKFENERAFNKVKNLWYTTPKKKSNSNG